MYISEDIKYVGVNDHDLDLFEGHYHVPKGMAYNSYVIMDEKIAVMDSVEKGFTDLWLGNIEKVLDGKKPSYLVIHHMEPDHSGNIVNFMAKYPEAVIVASAKAFDMMYNFFGAKFDDRRLVMGNGDTLDLGKHKLTFFTAPMVHWPEVISSYDSTDKVLFSADAFGTFGANDEEFDWDDEARRYFVGIVGKYGQQVQMLLKKLQEVDIKIICSLHGPVITENLEHRVGLYDTWSSYRPESDGIFIPYTSVYGNTKAAVELLAEKLREKGCPEVVTMDLARTDMSTAVANAFKYGTIVMATTTFNADIFPYMKEFISSIVERNFQNRHLAFIENGSWAPMAGKVMRGMLANTQNMTYAATTVHLLSSLCDDSRAEIEALAEELAARCKGGASQGGNAAPTEAKPKKRFVCTVCGYIHEAEELPADFTCPLCMQPASAFKEM